MPPRFLQRMQRQSDVLRDVFGDPQNDPPPYPFSPAGSSTSSLQYRQTGDLSAYQGRFSQDTAYSATSTNRHRRQDSNQSHQSSPSLHYQQGGDESASYNFPPPPGYTPRRENIDISALPLDSQVLVTGANSYQGLHIADQLLQQGFRVRGTVRDAEKAVWTAKWFRDRYGAGRYTTAVIPDMAAQHAFALAVRGCSGVVHVASVTTHSTNPHEVITPSIAGAVNALEAAAKEPNMRRVVLTSCASAAVSHDRAVRNVVGVESWNLLDFEDAWTPSLEVEGYGVEQPEREADGRLAAVQASAKMQAEQAVWRWYSDQRPKFVLNTVLPDTLWGPPVCPMQQHEQLPSSILLLLDVLNRSPSWGPKCGHFVNVSDAAALHLAALLFPDVRNERIFAVSIPWTRTSINQTLSRLFPERMKALEKEIGAVQGDNEESMDLTVFKDVERAEELLKRMGRQGWRDLAGSVRGAVEGFL